MISRAYATFVLGAAAGAYLVDAGIVGVGFFVGAVIGLAVVGVLEVAATVARIELRHRRRAQERDQQ